MAFAPPPMRKPDWLSKYSTSSAVAPKRANFPPPQPAPAPAAASPPSDPADRLARLGGPAAIPQLARTDLGAARLDHRAGFLLTFIDGAATLDDLLDSTGLPRQDVLAIVEDLVAAGVLRMR